MSWGGRGMDLESWVVSVVVRVVFWEDLFWTVILVVFGLKKVWEGMGNV